MSFAYGVSQTMLQVLKQCGDDFSRENIMKQATNLQDCRRSRRCCRASRSTPARPTIHPIRAMQLVKWDGKTWVRFGDVIEGAQS